MGDVETKPTLSMYLQSTLRRAATKCELSQSGCVTLASMSNNTQIWWLKGVPCTPFLSVPGLCLRHLVPATGTKEGPHSLGGRGTGSASDDLNACTWVTPCFWSHPFDQKSVWAREIGQWDLSVFPGRRK